MVLIDFHYSLVHQKDQDDCANVVFVQVIFALSNLHSTKTLSSNDKLVVFTKVIGRDFEVERRWSFTDSSGDVVV